MREGLFEKDEEEKSWESKDRSLNKESVVVKMGLD